MLKKNKNTVIKKMKKDTSISDKEMSELKNLFPSLRKGLKEAKKGKFTIVRWNHIVLKRENMLIEKNYNFVSKANFACVL